MRCWLCDRATSRKGRPAWWSRAPAPSCNAGVRAQSARTGRSPTRRSGGFPCRSSQRQLTGVAWADHLREPQRRTPGPLQRSANLPGVPRRRWPWRHGNLSALVPAYRGERDRAWSRQRSRSGIPGHTSTAITEGHYIERDHTIDPTPAAHLERTLRPDSPDGALLVLMVNRLSPGNSRTSQ